MQPFNVAETPLSGFHFIEASAGTGKTYTIAALYLRLIIEAGIPIHRLLVVTYTNAATKELRDRIRTLLVETHSALVDGTASVVCGFVNNDLAIRRLSHAVRGFDEAAIYTIHGFCKRALKDNAFESGLSFKTELLADTGTLLQEIVDDFWRRTFYFASPTMIKNLLEGKDSPEKLLRSIKPYLGKPYLRVHTPDDGINAPVLEQIIMDDYQKAQMIWRTECAVIEELLLSAPGLNRNSYALKSIPSWCTEIGEYFTADTPTLALPKHFSHFTTFHLNKSAKKNRLAPQHTFFEICQSLKTACNALSAHVYHQIQAQLITYCDAELAQRKRQLHVQSYDDLLLNLHRALAHPRYGDFFAKKLRHRYSAALIDEFQDTDPVQYDIFHRIYADNQQPVFLVGDPKQAIYSFRGADIFTYMKARTETALKAPNNKETVHTLNVNWRSDPDLLVGINAIFGACHTLPFVFEDITFHDAHPAKKDREVLQIKGQSTAPVQLWFLESTDPTVELTKKEAEQWATKATAAEIARLLHLGAQDMAHIGNRPLIGGDIAVLVHTHQQGRLIREHLLRLNVPSVQHAQQSVFHSNEAQQFMWLLEAVWAPNNEGHLRAALASDWMGFDGVQLSALYADEQAWARQLETFQAYRKVWQQWGFIRFFRAWFMKENIASRLLAFRDGERRLTNLLHLAELLHLESCTHVGMTAVVKYLAERRSATSRSNEEDQLRLESDEHLVRIVTIHKSKGLQYAITFCPFAWFGKDAARQSSNAVLYHPKDNLGTSVLGIGLAADDPARQDAQQEAMAERVRLFYVALTRAQHRCYWVWGKINGAGMTPPAWLLHRAAGNNMAQTRERFHAMDAAAIRRELHEKLRAAGDAIAITPLLYSTTHSLELLESNAVPMLQARTFHGSLASLWRVGSFTALMAHTSGSQQKPEIRDEDTSIVVAATAIVEDIPQNRDHISFPRGARAGVCVHALLERIDFTQPTSDWQAVITHTLAEKGFDADQWAMTVTDWMKQVIATPLTAEGFTLGYITVERRINELEFTYPLAHLRAEKLCGLLKSHGFAVAPYQEMIDRLDFIPVRGYMKGVIDMIFEENGQFYLVDYKSNDLGAGSSAYSRAELTEVMAREAYVLQYLIYTVAVHRYLQQRVQGYDYDQNFGGVLYLFLRGMHPCTGSERGVFYTKPSVALISALDQLMSTGAY